MFILIYNTILTAGLLILFPIVLPLVLTAEKRRRTFRQRMGWTHYPWQKDSEKISTENIWVHALSVGEMMSAQPLIERLHETCRDATIFVTASTLSGFQTARRIFPDPSIHIGYFPYDHIWAVRKVCRMIRPTQVIITETDIWPTFMWEMKRKRVPVYLVNLRISNRTWKNYKRFKWLAKSMYSAFDRLCVQTPGELEKLTRLAIPAHRISVTGNLKFDAMEMGNRWTKTPQRAGMRQLPEGQRLIVAGSTHEGEEAILCEALGPVLIKNPGVSIVIAPRNPDRSPAILRICQEHGLDGSLLSRMKTPEKDGFPQVVIVDAIGLLRDIYSLASLSFVGGSMAPFGGHNPLEPAFWGKPVLFGNDMRDFEMIADYLVTGGGALRVTDAEHLQLAVSQLLNNPKLSEKIGQSALNVVKVHQGAVERTLVHLEMAA